MSNIKTIVESLGNEDVSTAQKLIKEELLKKLGNALEEKLVEFAPTVFNEATDKKKFAALAEPRDKITYADKIAGAKKKTKTNEDVDTDDEELKEISEAFEQELASIVEEIQEETGEELTEEEIAELANELLSALSEENEEDEDEDEDEEGSGKEGGTDTNY